jgi:hypothetical protein
MADHDCSTHTPLALISTAETVLQDMLEDIEATQALAEMIQDAYLQSSYHNARLSALIDAAQNRTCSALSQSKRGIASIEKVIALAKQQAGIKDEKRNTDDTLGAADMANGSRRPALWSLAQ